MIFISVLERRLSELCATIFCMDLNDLTETK